MYERPYLETQEHRPRGGLFELDNGLFPRKKQITSYPAAQKSTSKEEICSTELNTLFSLYKQKNMFKTGSEYHC